ncbi:hypothetical protein AAMO2058_000524400 [Amorphochlora amoebiformis]
MEYKLSFSTHPFVRRAVSLRRLAITVSSLAIFTIFSPKSSPCCRRDVILRKSMPTFRGGCSKSWQDSTEGEGGDTPSEIDGLPVFKGALVDNSRTSTGWEETDSWEGVNRLALINGSQTVHPDFLDHARPMRFEEQHEIEETRKKYEKLGLNVGKTPEKRPLHPDSRPTPFNPDYVSESEREFNRGLERCVGPPLTDEFKRHWDSNEWMEDMDFEKLRIEAVQSLAANNFEIQGSPISESSSDDYRYALPVPIESDPNSLFKSIAVMIYNDHTYDEVVRQEIFEWEEKYLLPSSLTYMGLSPGMRETIYNDRISRIRGYLDTNNWTDPNPNPTPKPPYPPPLRDVSKVRKHIDEIEGRGRNSGGDLGGSWELGPGIPPGSTGGSPGGFLEVVVAAHVYSCEVHVFMGHMQSGDVRTVFPMGNTKQSPIGLIYRDDGHWDGAIPFLPENITSPNIRYTPRSVTSF